MKPKLTKEQKEGVREWLKKRYSLQDVTCPFGICNDLNSAICIGWFPIILADRNKGFTCPCVKYGVFEVIKRAKQMIGGPT